MLPLAIGLLVATASTSQGPVLAFELSGSAGSTEAGSSLSMVGTLAAEIPLTSVWGLGMDWPIAMLLTPGGVIIQAQTGERTVDVVPRTGNPSVELWRRLGPRTGPWQLELGLGLSLPMAAIPQPTPATGPDFQRAAHTESVYRWALGARGFVAPWSFLWNTATVRVFGRFERRIEQVELGGWVDLGLLVPAGRLRSEVGVVAAVGGRIRYLLDPIELGLRFDVGGVNAQRSSFDGSLQIQGVQLAVSPELRWWLPREVFLDLRITRVPGLEVEPEPPTGWGFAVAVGKRF